MKGILIFIGLTLTCSCASLKNGKYENVFIPRGYYFVIQLQSVKSDTIFFETVEIYSPSPILESSTPNPDSAVLRLVKLPLKEFNIGYLKGAKKNAIGNVMLLYTNPDRIDKNNFVNFNYIDYLEWTELSKMYRLGK